jgi:long-chain acyl-CoA synthetase
MNLAKNLENSARFFPNKPAIREGELEFTYAQLNEKANRVATGLIKMDIKPGELVGICAPNSADWIIFYFAVLKTGASAITLANAVTPGELANLLTHSKPRILFTTPNRVKDLEYLKAPNMLEKIICSTDCDLSLKDLMNSGSAKFEAVERERDDIAAILYTGGTTGNPKGVMLTHEGMIFSSQAIAVYEHSTPNDFALCFQPFNHVFGQIHIMNSTILSAGCLVLVPTADLDQILKLTEAGRVTKFFSVPTVYVRMLEIPDLKKKLGKVNYCFSAAASMAREIVKQWKERTGITIAESLGMTECMPISFNHYYPEQHVVGSVGQPVCGVEVQIRHTSGQQLETGKEGEICVRGRNAMKGYLNNPEATKETFWEGGWLRTGDIGYLDENGFLYIVDRLKELIITGGENVFPREVEEALYTIPEVSECSAVGLPDKEWGERVAAFIKLKPGQTIASDKIKAYLKTKLAPFKVPKEYVFMDDLPKSPNGKILKREIKRQYLEKNK